MKPLDPLRYVKRKLFPPPSVEYFPTDAWTDPSYEQWFLDNKASFEELERQRMERFEWRPKFSIIVPLFKTPIDYLEMMVESVLRQTYHNFELILVNASPENEELAVSVKAFVDHDSRVKQVLLGGNYGITENTNCGIDVATGDFMCFMDHDDFIEPNLLFEYVSVLNEDRDIDVLYCDEDLVEVLDGKVRYIHPLFKPSYSPELLLCKNYIVHLMTVRSSLVREMIRPDCSYDGAQDYNMVLRCTKVARAVRGVQKVLYHWRMSSGSTAANPQAKLYSRRGYRKSAFDRIRSQFPFGRIVSSGITNIHNVWICADNAPKVSIVVDCADSPARINAFLEMLAQSSCCRSMEIVSVSKPSRESLAVEDEYGFELTEVYSASDNMFERLNSGAFAAAGEFLLFLEPEDVLVTPEFVEQMGGLCASEGIGVVGAKGLYSDGSVRNYGIAVTPERIMPLYRGYPDEFPAYECNTRAFQNFSAVSWHGMMASNGLFQQVGGFDGSYEGEIGSVDFCQKIMKLGKRIVQTPTAKIQTSERPPEKRYDCTENSREFTKRDVMLFDSNWPGVREKGDPFFNRNLDQSSEYCQIKEFYRCQDVD